VRAGVVVVAAGSGTRMGRPKQFLPLSGRGVCQWAIEAFRSLEEVAHVSVVLTPENIAEFGESLRAEGVSIVEGGVTRMGSVRNGFQALPDDIDVVAVHDGARPLIDADTIRATFKAASEHGAAVAAVPAKDTLKFATPEGDAVESTPDRSRFWQAQTPQTYQKDLLSKALSSYDGKEDITDESQLVERLGAPIRLVRSTYENIKITTPEDLVVAEAFMNKRQGTAAAGAVRTGFGYDIHKLVEGRPMVLAGVTLEHDKGPLGHSDGDVAFHAGCDAVLGALGEGEIGIAFPPSDPKFKDIDSLKIVENTMEKVAARGARLVHLDVTVVAEEPKLKPHYEALKASLAKAFGSEPGSVSLKAKSREGLGAVGRGEAIEAYAVASVASSS